MTITAPTSRVAFGAHGRVVGCRTSDAAMARALARLLAPYRAPAPAGDAEIAEWVTVRHEHGTWLVGDPRGGEVACADRAAARDTAEYFLTLRLLDALADHVHVHASGVALGAGAVLALGHSGAGKSSLALHWSVTGHPVYGDDVVLLGDDGRARAFMRAFRVDPARLDRYGGRAIPLVPAVDDEAWFAPGAHGGWAVPAAPTLLADVRFEPGARLEMATGSRAEALALLVAATLQTGRVRDAAFDTLLRAVSGARLVHVVFGDAVEAAAALAEDA